MDSRLMLDYRKYPNTNLKIGITALFLFNPFITIFLVFFLLYKIDFSEANYRFFSVLVSLFFALLAFTQKTDVGDLSRTYSIIESSFYIAGNNLKDYFFYAIVSEKYVIFSVVNALIYAITGNVQYTSLLWVFVIYYSFLIGVLNIIKYQKEKPNRKYVFWLFFSSIVSFMIFTQVTEIMKQAIALSLFFYGFSSYLLDKKRKAIFVLLIAFGIHFSILFFIPMFFVNKIKYKILIYITLISFIFRFFNLMSFVVDFFSIIGFHSQIAETAEGYIHNYKDFFSPSAPFFLASFFFFFMLTMFVVYIKPKNPSLVKVSLLMIIVLNLNYSNGHNFTRMMTLMYPFYVLLLFDVLNKSRITNKIRSISVLFILLIPMWLNYRMASGRLSAVSSYATSFMDNSILKIATSSIYSYLSYRI